MLMPRQKTPNLSLPTLDHGDFDLSSQTTEPGLFLVSEQQTLFYGSVQTMPFVRPHFSELLGAVDFAIANNYPARGEYTGAV